MNTTRYPESPSNDCQDDTLLFVYRYDCYNNKDSIENTHHAIRLIEHLFFQKYGKTYDDTSILSFNQSPNAPIARGSYESERILELLARKSEEGGRLVIVMLGWDGLTTHEFSLYMLFGEFSDICDLFLFGHQVRGDITSQRFFRVDVPVLCDIIRGNLFTAPPSRPGYEINGRPHQNNPASIPITLPKIHLQTGDVRTQPVVYVNITDDSAFPYDTARFVRRIRAIGARYHAAVLGREFDDWDFLTP